MTEIRTAAVDLYVVRVIPGGLEYLLLRRAPGERSAGSWEGVHGHLDDGESPAEGAQRELSEETGLVSERLYNLSRSESFYLHRTDTVAVLPVFAAIVDPDSAVRLSPEHDRYEWLGLEAAIIRASWPRTRRALADLAVLLPGGEAGSLEDVLRIC